ncbi:hypothetical protein [Streptomyces sp. NPDC056544]|uniref:hypothetical protein n=1 Tax=unclassified Streptomyces TaxID=2593676 RepID=UPI00369208C4
MTRLLPALGVRHLGVGADVVLVGYFWAKQKDFETERQQRTLTHMLGHPAVSLSDILTAH